MDKDTATRFVSILLGVLRGEIAETTARAERLAEAGKHNAVRRAAAAELLARVRNQRAERERRRMDAEMASPDGG